MVSIKKNTRKCMFYTFTQNAYRITERLHYFATSRYASDERYVLKLYLLSITVRSTNTVLKFSTKTYYDLTVRISLFNTLFNTIKQGDSDYYSWLSILTKEAYFQF